jgi:hypothetical protein
MKDLTITQYLFSPQLKSLFENFTFVSERNIKYQYLILASLILVACYRNSVSRFSINKVFLILGLFAYFLYTFVFDPRVTITQYQNHCKACCLYLCQPCLQRRMLIFLSNTLSLRVTISDY